MTSHCTSHYYSLARDCQHLEGFLVQQVTNWSGVSVCPCVLVSMVNIDWLQSEDDLNICNQINFFKSLSFSLDHRKNTPGTRGGPGGRDQTLAVKWRKNARKSALFIQKSKLSKKNIFFCIYLLVMPKCWRKQIFSLGSFPEAVSYTHLTLPTILRV